MPGFMGFCLFCLTTIDTSVPWQSSALSNAFVVFFQWVISDNWSPKVPIKYFHWRTWQCCKCFYVFLPGVHMVWFSRWRRRGWAASAWSPTPPHTDLRADLSHTATLLLPVCRGQSHYRSTPPCRLSSDSLPSKQRCCGAFFPLDLWITNILNNELFIWASDWHL